MAINRTFGMDGGSVTVSDNIIFDSGGGVWGEIDDYGNITGPNGKHYKLNAYGTVVDTDTGREFAQIMHDGTLMKYNQPEQSRSSSQSSSGGGSEVSTLGALAVVFAWILCIGISDALALGFVLVGVFMVMLAGFAFPSVGALLTQTEVVPMLEGQIDKYVPGLLSHFRDPGTAQVIFGALVALAAVGLVLELMGYIRVFRKAGVSPIFLFVPVANLYQICSISGGGFLLFICMMIPGVQLLASVALNIGLSRSFGRSALFAIPLMLCPPLFLNLLPFRRDYIE